MEDEIECSDGSTVKFVDEAEFEWSASSFVDRYFEKRYAVSANGREDMRLLRHSNGILVVTVSEHHDVVVSTKKIVSVDLRPDFQTPKGKRKRQGVFVQEGTILCTVHLEGETQYRLRANVRGVLLELNEQIVSKPSLLREQSLGEGFLAVVLPKQGATKSDPFNSLVKPAEYGALVTARRDEAAAQEAVVTAGEGRAIANEPTEAQPAAVAAQEIVAPAAGTDEQGGGDAPSGPAHAAPAGPAGIPATAANSTASVAADEGQMEAEAPGATVPEDSVPTGTVPREKVPPDTVPQETAPPDPVPEDTARLEGGS